MKAVMILAVAAGAIFAQVAAGDAQDRTERVEFPRGSTGTVVTGRLGSEQAIRYVLGAGDGQFLSVSLRPDNPQTYYIIYVPGGDILYESSQAGNEYSGQLYKSGDHVVEVFYKGEPGTYGNYDVAFDISANANNTGATDSPSGTQASPSDPASMMATCRDRAAREFQLRQPDVETKYEGQRVDGTHAVNGTAYRPNGQDTFQCSFNSDGSAILQFVVN